MTERRQLLQEALAAIERLEGRLRDAEEARRAPLAIVGAGCRFPGGVEDLDGLWRLVRDGVDAVTEVPADRWDVDAYYSPDPKAPGKMNVRRAGFLERVDRFDARFFGISPREAATMDPQQRLLLETAVEALERAGLPADRLAGTATGVFVGITTSDYGQLLRRGGPEHSDVYSATGSALNAAAGRLSFTFGFQGPCVAVDTACSSSLVALHLACQSLRAGESDLALAGGVNVVLAPDAMVLFSKWGMMAPDGACKTFDAAADGFVRAEGCAVLALKRLSDAVAAGDPILAVVRGSAVNSDGRSSGLTVPNGPAQEAVIRKALASAGLAPADLDYVEAHGTGTSLGDPIELEALGAVMREGRPADRPLRVGSIKTNIGHCEAASGLAGVLKAVVALRSEAIPAHLHFSTPNPRIPWADLPLAVPTALTPWPRGARPRRAGVSSFGFSGTNAHVVLEEAPAPAPSAAVPAGTPLVVPLSAHDEPALRALAARTADLLDAVPATPVADVAWTAGTGRAHRSRRVALLADSTADLARDLRAVSEGRLPALAAGGTVRPGERPRIAFLYTGQGAQYPGMARGLYQHEPAFRAALDRAAAALAPHLPRPLLEVLFPAEGAPTPLSETAFTQPALFALEWALTELWRSWGITPACVLGHSVGEYAAACAAGVMSLEDGLSLIAERGRLMQALPAGGAMAAVFAPEPQVSARIAPHRERLAIAAVNGPEETVISGDADALARVLDACAAEGVQARRLDVSHAFHSHRLDPMLDALERRAASVAAAAPRIPLVSNLTGAPFAPGAAPDAAYWRRHAREPVRFAASLQALEAAGITALVEIGPHPTLLGLAGRACPGARWIALASLRRGRDDRREIRAALAAVYARGAPVDFEAVEPGRRGRRIALPTYPFQRERHWVKAAAPAARAAVGHPLLGERRELASAPGTHVWETELDLARHPWLGDHRVQGAAIVPATAYIEMALAAAQEALGADGVRISGIENLKPLVLHEGAARTLQATLTVEPGQGARFAVHSRLGASPWIGHVTARVAPLAPLAPAEAGAAAAGPAAVEEARARCARAVEGRAFYAALERKGNGWGPCFQGLQAAWIGEGEAVARVQVAPGLRDEVGRYRFHPAVSDACGHALVATVPLAADAGSTGGAFVGGGVGEIRFHRSPRGTTLWAHARCRPRGPGERVVVGDVRVFDEAGALVSETLDARLWYLEPGAEGALLGVPDGWFHEVRWRPQERSGAGSRRAAPGDWIVIADRIGLAERIAARRAAAGARTVLVAPGAGFELAGDRATVRPSAPADWRALLAAIPSPAVLLHLGAIGAPPEEALDAGPERLLDLLRGRPAEARARTRLWIATQGSQAAVPGDRCADPFGATLWGMARSLSAEEPELFGGAIDLDGAAGPEAAVEQLLAELEAGCGEDAVAFRAGRRHVARLARRAAPPGGAGPAPSPSATYLVTGGLGGIGLAMARWLVDRGARHLLLLGRTPLPPREAWAGLPPGGDGAARVEAIRALEAGGARVEVAAVDVAVAGPLEACLAAREARGEPPVRGVIHAAGVLGFAPLGAPDGAGLRDAVAAKVDGAWRLHRLLGGGLELFVLCSSTSALLPSPLLGRYAAGNAFLDALAHHRRALGMAALSVNWGTWGEVGMAVGAGRARGGDMLAGMGTIPTAGGLAALEGLLEEGVAQAAVMPVDWAELARAYPAFAADPFLAEVAGAAAPAGEGEVAGATLAALRRASEADRPGRLEAYLRAAAAGILGMEPAALDVATPLSGVGFDSLMAVQLKNRLEKDLGVVVPMMQLLQGPALDQLAPAVLAGLASAGEGGEAAAGDAGAFEEGSL